MLCPTIKLVAVLLLLPAIIGHHIDHPRIRRSLMGYGKPHKNTRSGGSSFRSPHLRLRKTPPSSLFLTAGESKVLECEAGGNPPPTIHWLKNGRRFNQDLMPSNDVDDGNHDIAPLLGLSFTRSRLYLDCVTEQDAGEYTCVADNPYYRTNAKTKIQLVDQEKNTDVFCLTKKSYGVPARIHMWTHTRLEMMGSDVQLFCRVTGRPEPQVEWLRSPPDTIIRDSDKYQVLDNGDLVIRNIEWEDMGNYICISKNVHGDDQTSTFLYPTMPEK